MLNALVGDFFVINLVVDVMQPGVLIGRYAPMQPPSHSASSPHPAGPLTVYRLSSPNLTARHTTLLGISGTSSHRWR